MEQKHESISLAIATNCNPEKYIPNGFFPNGSVIGGNEATEIFSQINVFNNYWDITQCCERAGRLSW